MPTPFVTCLLVGALCLAIGGFITAAVVFAIILAIVEFFLPGLLAD